jgi:hypothetical protein
MLNYQGQNTWDSHLGQNLSTRRLYYDGKYSSENGVTDIYPEVAATLRKAMVEKDSFVFEGQARQSDSIRYNIEKTQDEYQLSVSDFIEQDEDLIADAIHALEVSDDVLSVEQRETILNSMLDSHISSEAKVTATLPLSSSYEDITEKLNQLWKDANGRLEKQFAQVKDMVEGYLM